MIERISGQLPRQSVQPAQGKPASRRFGDVLQQEIGKGAQPQVAFSKHAISRAEARGIQVTEGLMEQLAGSVERAQAKGATNILAMDAANAFIINVPSARVITAITQDEMKESVFTNIDGAVFLK